MNTRSVPFTLLALSLTLGAFPTTTQAATKDACSLLASTDVQAVLNEPVGAPKSESRNSGIGDGSSCKYRSTIGTALSAKSVLVEVHYSNTDLTGSSPGIAENLKSAGFKSVRDVPGIGAAAVWGTYSMVGKLQGELTVIQGKSVMLNVIISGIANEAEGLARAKIIAAKAIAKL